MWQMFNIKTSLHTPLSSLKFHSRHHVCSQHYSHRRLRSPLHYNPTAKEWPSSKVTTSAISFSSVPSPPFTQSLRWPSPQQHLLNYCNSLSTGLQTLPFVFQDLIFFLFQLCFSRLLVWHGTEIQISLGFSPFMCSGEPGWPKSTP